MSTGVINETASVTVHRGQWSEGMMCFDDQGSNLIFLISLPHGGGAMFREMLGDHKDIHAPTEPCVMLHTLLAMKRQGQSAECGSPGMRMALDTFVKRLPAGERDYLDALRAMAAVLYGRALAGSGKSVFLDSTTLNHHVIPELCSVFPKARFVFLVRNPVAVLMSALINNFDADVEAFRESRCYREIILGISHMHSAITSLGQAVTVVDFEVLQTKPDAILESLYRQYGLAQDPSIGTAYHGNHCRSDLSLALMIGQEASHPRSQILKCFALEELRKMGDDPIRILGYDHQQIRKDIEVSLPPGLPAGDISAAELNRLGEERFEADDHDAARRIFEQVLEIDTHNCDAMNNLAIIHATQGDIELSLKLLTQVLRIDPVHREAVLNYAAISTASGSPHEAGPICIAYLKSNPSDSQIRGLLDGIMRSVDTPSATADDLNRLGEQLFSSGDLEGAKARFLAAYERAPDNATICNNLGVLFGYLGATEDALRYTERAIEADPYNGSFVSNAVKLRVESGRLQEALTICASYMQDYAVISADQSVSCIVQCGDDLGTRAL